MTGRVDLLRGVVHPWHHDQFGHMNVRHYAPFFDDATFHLWSLVGLPYARMLAEHGVHTVTARATTSFLRELKAGDLIRIDGAVTRLGNRSVTFDLRMFHADTGELHARCEVVEVFFDPQTRGSAPIPPAVRAQLADWLVAPE